MMNDIQQNAVGQEDYQFILIVGPIGDECLRSSYSSTHYQVGLQYCLERTEVGEPHQE